MSREHELKNTIETATNELKKAMTVLQHVGILSQAMEKGAASPEMTD